MKNSRKKYVVGIIGGIATGKSTIAKYLKTFNIPIIDTDIIAQRLYDPEQPGFEPIVERYGQDILKNDHIDRKKLADIIYASPCEKMWLEQLLHPLVRCVSLNELKDDCSYNILMIPLLKDRNNYPLDQVILTHASFETQVKRLNEYRNINEKKAQMIINNQPSFEQQSLIADHIINTDKELSEVYETVKKIHEELILIFNS